MTKLIDYKVSINDSAYFAVSGNNLDNVENLVIENHLNDMPDRTRAYIKHNDRIVTMIIKDKSKKHHTHNGYMFSA